MDERTHLRNGGFGAMQQLLGELTQTLTHAVLGLDAPRCPRQQPFGTARALSSA